MIGRRAMSRATLEKKLREKGASEAETRYAAEWLEAIGAINDAEYAALLVRHCAGRGYGPARVREKLYEKGIPRELWDEALETMPDPAEQIDRFLQEKLRGRTPDERRKSGFPMRCCAGDSAGATLRRDSTVWARSCMRNKAKRRRQSWVIKSRLFPWDVPKTR